MINHELLNNLALRYSQGERLCNLEKESGIYRHAIIKQIKVLNIPLRGCKQLNKEQLEELINLYLNNYKTKELAKRFDITQTSVVQILRRYCIPRRPNNEEYRKYLINENYFDNIDTERKAYFLGLLYADGCNLGTGFAISLQKRDKNILLALARELYPGTKHPFYDQFGKYPKFVCINKRISEQLSKHGCVKNKTFRLAFPKSLSPKLYWHFLRGLFDGDGCAHLQRQNTKLTVSIVGYRPFLLEIKSFLNKEGIKSNVYKTSSKNLKVAELIVSDNLSSTKFYFLAYNNCGDICLFRKRSKFYEFFKVHSFRKQA